MIRKVVFTALASTLVLSFAAPASAAPAPRWNGYFVGSAQDPDVTGWASVRQKADGTYSADVALNKLNAGEYYVFLNAYVDANGDGFPDFGGAQLVCRLTSNGKKRASCNAAGLKFHESLTPWDVTVHPVYPNPNVVVAKAALPH
ncbi:MAG: hypothetical protein ACT4OX_16685 [Actinomycetota bacterium]